MPTYLNVVTSAPPAGKGQTYDTGPVMVSLAVENDDRKITSVLLRRISPEANWKLDPAWCAKYGVGPENDGETTLFNTVSNEVVGLLHGNLPLISHFRQFHTRALGKLIGPLHDFVIAEGICTMNRAAPICNIPDRWGRGFKQPNLDEAQGFFTGGPMPAMAGLSWRQAALAHLTSVRRIWWGVNRWGIAPELKEEPTA